MTSTAMAMPTLDLSTCLPAAVRRFREPFAEIASDVKWWARTMTSLVYPPEPAGEQDGTSWLSWSDHVTSNFTRDSVMDKLANEVCVPSVLLLLTSPSGGSVLLSGFSFDPQIWHALAGCVMAVGGCVLVGLGLKEGFRGCVARGAVAMAICSVEHFLLVSPGLFAAVAGHITGVMFHSNASIAATTRLAVQYLGDSVVWPLIMTNVCEAGHSDDCSDMMLPVFGSAWFALAAAFTSDHLAVQGSVYHLLGIVYTMAPLRCVGHAEDRIQFDLTVAGTTYALVQVSGILGIIPAESLANTLTFFDATCKSSICLASSTEYVRGTNISPWTDLTDAWVGAWRSSICSWLSKTTAATRRNRIQNEIDPASDQQPATFEAEDSDLSNHNANHQEPEEEGQRDTRALGRRRGQTWATRSDP
eukprot:gb/GFBE01041143.1/.p1 GENE.gb/GFBE01041143.1/~~gb/GFBE01041143.1/.p1  ORF type:complete len:417 (+),score=50.90 gb/GFBE01041143.1/:1-1251(+)